MGKKRKSGEKREKKKGRKAERQDEKMKGKKKTKRKVMKEKSEKWWKKKSETKKKEWKNKDEFFLVLILSWEKVKGEKGRTRNFKKQFKNWKGLFHTLFKKQTRAQKKKEKWQKEKKQKMSSPICWRKNNIFQIHHNRQAKNTKTGETIFQDTET